MVPEHSLFMFRLNNIQGLAILLGWMFVVNAYTFRAQVHDNKKEFKVIEKLPKELPSPKIKKRR